MQQVIERDNGVSTLVKLNADGSMTTGTIQDCTPIVEKAKALHNAGIHGSSEMRHAASIPMVIIEKYLNDNNILLSDFMNNKDHQRRLLNDPALSFFRIWKGAI